MPPIGLITTDPRSRANVEARIDLPNSRVEVNVLGSVDFAGGVLTLVQFTMPEDPTRHDHMNNMWQLV